jgi:hypothetical protein
VLPTIGLLFTLVQRNLMEETARPSPAADFERVSARHDH